MEESASDPARWRKSLMASFVLAVLTLAAYSNGLFGEFIFDDASSIVKNGSLGRIWPFWAPLVSPSTGGTRGRPFANLTLALNHWVGGLDVFGYHATNLAIHILAGWTLFGIMRRTFAKPILAARLRAAAFPLALAVSALWLLHPLLTEDVTYLSQRTESLMGLCYLATLYCVIRGAGAADPARWYALAVATNLLGMASKEIMVTAPVVILFYDRTFLAGSFRRAWGLRRHLYLGLAGGWILLGCLMMGIRERGAGLGLGISPARYALGECRAIVRYLGLSVWPHPLVFDYGVDLGPGGMAAVPYALAILALAVGTLVALRFRPAVGFAMFWFCAILAPTSSVVPVALQPVAEHRMYLPLVAVIALFVSAAFASIGRGSLALFAALALGLGCATWERNGDYRTALLIWTDTVAKRPMNARARCNLGNALLGAGQTEAGMGQLNAALQISPDDPEANLDLGVALGRTGNYAEALSRVQRAIKGNPALVEGYFDLGWLYTQEGRIPEAFEHYGQAIALRPDYHDAHCNLADLLVKAGRYADAVPHYRAALEIGPPDPDLYYNLAYAEAKSGSPLGAVADFRKALALRPDFAEARHNLELMEGPRKTE